MPAAKENKSTICLNMIVKNEAHVIRRCLESAKPYVDSWVISDTGSTDGTQDLIREIMADIPGELIERPWQNFGHNRNEALEAASGKADYVLIIDADEELVCAEGFEFSNLTENAYYIYKEQPGQKYAILNIVKNDMGWYWEGVIHEALTNEHDDSRGEITYENAKIIARQEGARSLDPNTYRKDAALLTSALKKDPQNTRYQYYLAQSWRDAEEYGRAIKHYRKRIKMGGWHEEVFCAQYQIAMAMESRGDDWQKIQQAYLEAYAYTPVRCEPLYRIGLHYNEQQDWHMAWLFLSRAAQLDVPEGHILFIENPVYEYLAAIEAGVAAYYLGYYLEAIELNEKALASPEIPDHLRDLVRRNSDLCNDELKKLTSSAA